MTTTTHTSSYLEYIRKGMQKTYDEVDRTRRLISSYLLDAERELGFLTDQYLTAEDLLEGEAIVNEMTTMVTKVGETVGHYRLAPGEDSESDPFDDPDPFDDSDRF